jgi:hypothetical protein
MVIQPSARSSPSPEELAYQAVFGLQPRLAQLLAKLARERRIVALRVDVCRLRQALAPESIDTMDGRYALTDVGRRECQQARSEFSSWVRRMERSVA